MSYVYDKDAEYKGFGKRDKYKQRTIRITSDGIFECYEKKKVRISIHLVKEEWGDLKTASGEGKTMKSCWQFEYKGKTYNFASADDNERAEAMKQVQFFYDKQATMNQEISASGKYSRDSPNNDDFKEVQSIFENSTSDEFANGKKKARSKAAAQYWKMVKKDPYWKKDLYLLKEKHLGSGSAASGGAVAESKEEEAKDDTKDDEKEPAADTKSKKKGGFGGFKAKAAAAALAAKEKAAEKAAAYKAQKAAKNAKQAADEPEEPANNEPINAYEGQKKPDDDVRRDIDDIFTRSTHADFSSMDEKQRRKECAQYWKKMKKDKNWGITMTQFKNKHAAFLSDAGPTYTAPEQKDDRPAYVDDGVKVNPFSLIPADEKDEDDDEKEKIPPNLWPLITTSQEQLLRENIGAFRQQLGAEALGSRFDLVAHNDFCQILVGMGLVKGEDEEEEEEDDDDAPLGWTKQTDPDGRTFYQNIQTLETQFTRPADEEYKINRRPLDDDDDDLVPNVVHDGTIGKAIGFQPEDRDFTVMMEIKCGNLDRGNTIFSNGKIEYVARPGSRRLAVKQVQKANDKSELINLGETELNLGVWYHIAVVCYRANDEDKRPQTYFKCFLNGVVDGEVAIKKDTGGGLLGKIGGFFGKKKKKQTDYTPMIGVSPVSGGDKFFGVIKNVKVFYKALEHSDVKQLAYTGECEAYISPQMISYDKDSIRVEVCPSDMRYSGPDMGILPMQLQEFKPMKNDSFTMCCWIYCTRIGAAKGSVIMTNMNDGSWLIQNPGFEWVCPTDKSHVIGIRCSNAWDILPIGTREIKVNKFYHIAITVKKLITTGAEPDQTNIACYVNGKADGTYNWKTCKDYWSPKNNVWTIGHRLSDESNTRLDGSIADLRIFRRALEEAEVACVYAACAKERKFKRGESVYYLQCAASVCPKCHKVYAGGVSFCAQCGVSIPNVTVDANETTNADPNLLQTAMPGGSWKEGEFVSMNLATGNCTVQDAGNKRKVEVAFSECVCVESKIKRFIPGSQSQKITNLGGMIHGEDFNGARFKIYSTDSTFLRYICKPTSVSLMCKLELFQKHEFEAIVDNVNVDNKYLLNRLLFAAYHLLKDINDSKVLRAADPTDPKSKDWTRGKDLWSYFNQFLLPWSVWNEIRDDYVPPDAALMASTDQHDIEKRIMIETSKSNFEKLKRVAGHLQQTYKQLQFDVWAAEFEGRDHGIFKLNAGKDGLRKNEWLYQAAGTSNRQDGFSPGAMQSECDCKLWDEIDAQMAITYDLKVNTMYLWGRCLILQDPFQVFMKGLYAGNTEKYVYVKGPQKTYERMMEKAAEYRVVDGKAYPASFCIADINRCSIKCANVPDIFEAYKILENCDESQCSIVRVKNRFHPNFDHNDSGGYRDMLVNVLYTDLNTGFRIVGEVQFHYNSYEHIKHLQHKYYKIIRAENYMTLWKNFEARKWDK